MIKASLLLAIIIIQSNILFAQGKVQSLSYETMLATLLSHTVNEISVNELSKKLENMQVLDTREKREYDVSHLLHATWVGYDDFTIHRVDHLDKSKPVVLYCSVGYRSEKIGEQLIKAGFKEVYNLYGGIFEWVNQGQPIYNNLNQKINDVHAYDKVWGVWVTKGNKVYK